MAMKCAMPAPKPLRMYVACTARDAETTASRSGSTFTIGGSKHERRPSARLLVG
jgi:hypothetical protein